ncbi:TIGR01777 family oxidoreductase [Streptomyces sp. S.PB5]|uniref:TIGR01777 family oxidoreductase n=1 Tax=Streptomyces sp. S.PB5 TaxID=3020844 RepID=UPI0025AF9942|nr:TIGR01777 family oxidoreductase [Streptomyces sp. S.PB5]MDN3025816.1 TIGR01777 family oxidoreductase [Streptomyces sp. S.PB5]
MHVVISGSSGLIGGALAASLLGDGHRVTRLVRREPRPRDDGSQEARWDPQGGLLDPAVLDGADAVVGLAGAGVGDRRWTAAYKKRIRDSRVLGTTALATAITACEKPPTVFVSGSAVGYYGETGTTATDESGAPGQDFLAGVCQEWESAARAAGEAGTRVVNTRFGIVVSPRGGAMGRLLPLARAGLGGRLGSGDQYWSHISLTDTVRALRHLLDTESVAGPVNMTSPHPATNREVTAAVGRALHRPTVFTVPGFALRLVLGEFADGILMSQRVLPGALLASGFTFEHPTIEEALAAAVGRETLR